MTIALRLDRGRGSARVAFAAALALIILAGFLGYGFGVRQRPAPPATTPGISEMPSPPAAPAGVAAAPADERRVLYWHDPMVPNARFDKPGKSPFMDMQLVPVYADAAGSESSVAIGSRQLQNFGVRTALVTAGRVEAAFSAVGVIGIDERALVAVQARSQGYVERLHVRAQYDRVDAGQPLADLYVPDWLAAQEELLALKASTLPAARELADAARQRLRLLGMPEAEIARIERDGRTSARVTLTAPQAGIVWEIGARDGMAVMPGVTLFKLAGIGTVWVTADVPEAQAALVRAGTPVEARAAAFPDHAFRGTVNAMLPEVNVQSRTVRARIIVANPGGMLKPGMFATVRFGAADEGASVLVPAEAVIATGKRSVVIVDAGAGKFRPVDVETGRNSGDLVEIRKGLDVGQRVVVSGQFLIDSEANLKGALARIADGGGDAGGTPPANADPHAGHTMPAAPTVHKAQGIVRSVGEEVLIRHGAIASAGMGAMTMSFRAPKGGLPAGIVPGSSVNFEFVTMPQGEMQLTAIAPVEGARQ